MTKKRLPVDAVRCNAVRRGVVSGALPCFSQIQGSSLDSVCVWFMRKIEGPKEVGRSSADRRAPAGRREMVGWEKARVVAGRSGVLSVGAVDCRMTYRVDTLHQAVVKPSSQCEGGGCVAGLEDEECSCSSSSAAGRGARVSLGLAVA